MTPSALTAPFPYHGGKRAWAADVWPRLGRTDNYLEPFGGSLAMLLCCPHPAKREVVCERNHYITNAWRAIQEDPEGVAYYADRPTNHDDFRAAAIWLANWTERVIEMDLWADLDWYDSRAAGLWIWGQSLSIGLDFPAFKGKRKSDEIPLVSDRPGARGVSQQKRNIPNDRVPLVSDYPGARGVSQQKRNIPIDRVPTVNHVISGQGVSAQRRTIPSGPGRLVPWMLALSARIKPMTILDRDWKGITSNSVTMRTPSHPKHTTALFADPPYKTAQQNSAKYSLSDAAADDVAEAAWRWCSAPEQADDPRMRIAFCAHLGDFDLPAGWTRKTRDMQIRKAGKKPTTDCIMFSPHCLEPDQHGDLFA